MSIPEPTGGRRPEMIAGLWPQVDEDQLRARGQEFTTAATQLDAVITVWTQQHYMMFNDNMWSGIAAGAAQVMLQNFLDQMQALHTKMLDAAKWYENAADTVGGAKSTISETADEHQQTIDDVESQINNNSDLTDEDVKQLKQQIENEVTTAWNENSETVSNAGNGLGLKLDMPATPPSAPGAGKPDGLTASGGPRVAPGSQPPDVKAALNDGKSGNIPGHGAATPAGLQPPDAKAALNDGKSGSPPAHGAASPAGSHPPDAKATLNDGNSGNIPGTGPAPALAARPPAVAPTTSVSGVSTPSMPSGSGAGSSSSGSATSGLSGVGGGPGTSLSADASQGQQDLSGVLDGQQQQPQAAEPAVATGPAAGMGSAGLAAAAGEAAVLPASAGAAATAASAAAAASPAAAPVEHSGAVSGARVGGHAETGGAGSAGGMGSLGGLSGLAGGGSGSSPAPMPLGPPPTPSPAAPAAGGPGGGTPGTPASGPGGPGTHPASGSGTAGSQPGSTSTTGGADGAALAPVPVSAARAERDAIAAATTADALRRKHGGGDPVALARRIAAALNAPDMIRKADFRFFWVTAVTADGTIVVANSYGLAYIPEQVNLPEQVHLVSADPAVPAAERARWATYPMLAVQGWAAHHDIALRAVIATAEQFGQFDPGAYKVVLRDEDIPPSGKMAGRSRLEVVAPAKAAQLAGASEMGLLDMLPPAPVDANPPTDQRDTLWWEVMKHLMSSDPERVVQHLQAFATYTSHAQQLALYQAHTAVHAQAQRAAVADWLYWNHLAGLLADALTAPAAP